MKKLSSAQEKVLARIRERYEEDLIKEKKFYEQKVLNYNNDVLPLEYYEEHLEMANKGFILWSSSNSRTLKVLAENGYIEYIKRDLSRYVPIDYIKLLEK